MARLNTQQRQDAIVDLISTQGEVSVAALSARFNTSEVTIRKDLDQLEKARRLLRKFGGAISIKAEANRAPASTLSPLKRNIAHHAVELISPNARIVVDSGSTVLAMLPFITNRQDLVIMTNSLTVANQLTAAAHHPQVLFTGGTWDQQSQSFQGQMAERMLREYDFDFAFIGAAGLDPDRGTTTFNELTQLSQVMAEVSRRVVILAESGKLGKRIPNVELPWSTISTLITDDAISSASVNKIQQHGVDVICATAKEK